MGVIEETNLAGDVRFDGILTDVQMAEFLSRLDLLMREYRIIKLDIAYNPYAVQKSAQMGGGKDGDA